MLWLLLACLDHDPLPGDTEAFIAMQADFADYDSWPSVPVSTPDTGHVAGARTVFIRRDAPVDGADEATFPVGTLIVKTILTDSGMDLHAMVKRGGDFNPDGAFGWEWFELLTDEAGTPLIKWRGAAPPSGESYGALPGQTPDTGDSVSGDCNVCHGAAAANDFVHSVSL